VTTDPSDDTSFGGWRSCDVCGEPIASIQDAALVLRTALFEERRAALETAEGNGGDQPGLVPWDWGHRTCFDALEPMYMVEGPRMDTLPRMMARTLQLLDEPWFLETAWEDAVRRFYRVPLT
jgi:hypothetical protein